MDPGYRPSPPSPPSQLSTPTKIFSPWWVGYVLAALIAIGLIVMIVLFVKKPCTQNTCPPKCTSTDTGTCDDDGNCTSSSCSCKDCVNTQFDIGDMTTWIDCNKHMCQGTARLQSGKSCTHPSQTSALQHFPFSGDVFEDAFNGSLEGITKQGQVGIAYTNNIGQDSTAYNFTTCDTMENVVSGSSDQFVLVGRANLLN